MEKQKNQAFFYLVIVSDTPFAATSTETLVEVLEEAIAVSLADTLEFLLPSLSSKKQYAILLKFQKICKKLKNSIFKYHFNM